MNINTEFSKFYKGFKTSNSIELELKSIKKINNLISKWLKTNKDTYKKEILNIFRINENVFNVNSTFIEMIRNNFIEKDHLKYFDKFYMEYYE